MVDFLGDPYSTNVELFGEGLWEDSIVVHIKLGINFSCLFNMPYPDFNKLTYTQLPSD